VEGEFRIGEWLVQPELNRIAGPRGETRLEPKVMDVLVHLARHAGEVLPKERIIRAVWPDTFVTDDVLTHAISELRKAFGDPSKDSKIIETIPRRGYRLLQTPVFEEAAPAAETKTARRRLPLYFGAGALLVLVAASLFRPGGDAPAALRLTNPVLLTTAAGNKDYPTWRPDGSEVAYQSDQSGKWDIWVTQVKDGRSRNLTGDHEGTDLYPSWSPDGSRIAFWSSRDGGGEFVMPAVGGRPGKLASTSANIYVRRPGPAQWSPDGTELAFVHSADEWPALVVEIISVERGTSRRVPLPEHADRHRQGWELSWSPDGRFFASATVSDWASTASQIRILRLADLSAFPLMPDREYLEWSPNWGPEGHLYFVSNRGGSMDLWRLRLDEDATRHGSPERLTTAVDMRYAVFSPDRKRLAYSRTQPHQNVWSAPLLEGRPATWSETRQLTFEQAEIANLALSPDGGTLAFTLFRHGRRHVWLLPAEGGEMARLLADPMAQIMPRWSPDGREIAFHSLQAGNRHIWVAPVGGGPARNFTQTPQKGEWAAFAHPTWSPRGDKILFRSFRDGRPNAWIASRTGEGLRRLVDHPSTDVPGIQPWSPDGREVVFASDRGGNFDLWIVSVEGGEPRQLTNHPATDVKPLWSPDGRWVLFARDRSGVRSLWKVRPSGGEPEPVTERAVQFDAYDFSSDGSSIFFAADQNIYVVPADGGPERQLTEFKGKPGLLVEFQTDGRYLYFTWDESSGDIWVMDVVR
jgi:Tol biopolymer transport system component/DNA-binding winged helix-turn-helix (wHTH) protein